VSRDGLKLTVYFGERERAGGALLCDALHDLYERHAPAAAILMRGVEGFGLRHTLHAQRLLTLSEDLPLVSVAVDERPAIEAMLPEVTALVGKGLVTLERARLPDPGDGESVAAAAGPEATKLTVFCGRTERAGRRPAYEAVVGLLRAHGLAGATVMLGLDGMLRGRRERAWFFSRNGDVPLTIVSVGDGEAVASVLPALEGLLGRAPATLERVRVCKREGVMLAEPPSVAAEDELGLATWQKLTVYAGEQARHEGHSLSSQLVRRLREEGAAGATSLRGIWGYSGEHRPHGDRLFSLRRHVPLATVLVDRPEAMRRWWRIVDELTDEAGLVTSELVPALRAVGDGYERGGLRLAQRLPLPSALPPARSPGAGSIDGESDKKGAP
jgi:PII-like signaling protein